MMQEVDDDMIITPAEEEKIIAENEKFIYYCLQRHKIPYYGFDELIQLGRIGFLKAIRSYKPDKGGLLAYASRCIKNEAYMALRQARRSNRNVSLQTTYIDKRGQSVSLEDMVASGELPLEDLVINAEDTRGKLESYIEDVVNYLPPLEVVVFLLRIHNVTQKEIARKIDKTRSYVSRLETKARARMEKGLHSPQNKCRGIKLAIKDNCFYFYYPIPCEEQLRATASRLVSCQSTQYPKFCLKKCHGAILAKIPIGESSAHLIVDLFDLLKKDKVQAIVHYGDNTTTATRSVKTRYKDKDTATNRVRALVLAQAGRLFTFEEIRTQLPPADQKMMSRVLLNMVGEGQIERIKRGVYSAKDSNSGTLH